MGLSSKQTFGLMAIMLMVVGAVAIGAFAYLGGGSELSFVGGGQQADLEDTDDGVIDNVAGKSATVYLDAYSGAHSGAESESEVTPTYTVVDGDENKLVSDAAANSTATFVGQTVSVYGTGASYYVDPVLNFQVPNEAPRIKLDAYPVVATTDLVITTYDDTETTALTADDHANNTADYAGGALGAGEVYTYYIKQKVNVADKVWRLGAIATHYCGGEIDDFEMTEGNGWEEVSLPAGTMTDSFDLYDDTNASTSCSYKRAYEPQSVAGAIDGNGDGVKDFIQLLEWQWVKYQFTLDTDDSTGPSANGDSYCGAVFLDWDWEVDESGNIVGDWYKHNSARDPGAIGIDENPETTGFNSLDVGVTIEPQ